MDDRNNQIEWIEDFQFSVQKFIYYHFYFKMLIVLSLLIIIIIIIIIWNLCIK